MKLKDLLKINPRGTKHFIFDFECQPLFTYLEKITDFDYAYIETLFTRKIDYCGDIPF